MGKYLLNSHNGIIGVDQPKAQAVLERALDQKLVQDYFQKDLIYKTVAEEQYRSCAILQLYTDHNGQSVYMDKFGVDPELQKNGLGGETLDVVVKIAQSLGSGLFWRTNIKRIMALEWYKAFIRKRHEQEGAWYETDQWGIFRIGHVPGSHLLYAEQKPVTLQ